MPATHSPRPREKILTQSITALSDHELLQALIGNGGGGLTVGRIARETLKRLRRNQGALSYQQLLDIPGLGHAYTARIMAAFELARRWTYLGRSSLLTPIPLREDLRRQQVQSSSIFAYDLYDGADGFLERQVILLHESIDQTQVMRQLLGRILTVHPASVGIGITGDRKERMMYMSDIVYCRALKGIFETIGVRLRHFTVVSVDETRELL